MGRASSLLGARRGAAFAVVALLLGVYYAAHESLTDLSLWGDVAFLALCLMPLVFALVWLVLPYRQSRGLALLAIAFLAATIVFETAGLGALANFSKLGLMTSFAFWFLSFFESVLWVALVALVIPIVDSLSVWRGPTRHIVSPIDAVSASQLQPTRRRQRAAAARKSAKNNRSGRPRFADAS